MFDEKNIVRHGVIVKIFSCFAGMGCNFLCGRVNLFDRNGRFFLEIQMGCFIFFLEKEFIKMVVLFCEGWWLFYIDGFKVLCIFLCGFVGRWRFFFWDFYKFLLL